MRLPPHFRGRGGAGDTAARRIRLQAIRLGVLWGAGAAGVGCTRTAETQRFEPNPERIDIVATIPADGESGVDPDVQVDICFSGLVDPKVVDDFDVVMGSGRVTFDTELDLQLFPWRGPGGAALEPGATSPWCPGSVLSVAPRAELRSGVQYRIRLLPSAVGWAGEQLDVTQEGWILDENANFRFWLEFTVGDPAGDTGASGGTSGAGDTTGAGGTTGSGGTSGGEGPGDPPAGPTLTDLFADGGVFSPQPDRCSCHRDPGTVANELLDLRTPESAFTDLVLDGRVRDTGFPMVSERRPSESFLLHKLLRDADGTVIHGVLGDAMPPDGALPYPDLVAIATWIEAGALP